MISIIISAWIIISLVPEGNNIAPSTVTTTEGIANDATSSIPTANNDEEDDDEPLLSGNGGENLRTITDDELLVAWGALVTEWRQRLQSSAAASPTSLPPPPSVEEVVERSGAEALPDGALGRRVRQLIRRGIPDTLRTEIWQMMAGFQNTDAGLTEVYRILLTKVFFTLLFYILGISVEYIF